MDHPLPTYFATLVALAFGLSVTLRLWLSWRQERHVQSHRQQIPVAFAAQISLAAHQRAADYTVARVRLGRLDLLLEAGLFLALTWGGGLQALHEFWSEQFDAQAHDIRYGIALIASVVLINSLAGLPLELWRQFRLETRFGFNRMTAALFCSDLLKHTLLSAVLGLPLLGAVLWLVQAMGAAWWIYTWLLWMGFNLFILFAYPLWIAPLFNRFTALEEGELKTRVEALLHRAGFAGRALYVMDGSRRSNHGNAYFTGFGKARRIVFFDTLLSRLNPAQVEAVLAHELGHFHHRHIIKRILSLFLLSLIFLALLGQLLTAPWFHQGLGLEQGNTALALILFALTLPFFTFPLTPLFSAMSRQHEFEADAYAAQLTNGTDLATALVQLYEDNAATLTPDPLHSRFYDSHPPASQRIAQLLQHPLQAQAQAA